MRIGFLFIVLLCASSSRAYEVGMSPSRLQLDSEGHGYLTLINPNAFRMAYTLNSSAQLSRTQGIIESQQIVRVGVSSRSEAIVIATFGPELQENPLGISPQLHVRISPYTVPIKNGLSVLFGVAIATVLAVLIIGWRLQAYGS